MKFKTLFLSFILFISSSQSVFSQLNEFNTHRHQMDKKLMLGLGSWAGLNILGSGIGWATSTNEQTNLFIK